MQVLRRAMKDVLLSIDLGTLSASAGEAVRARVRYGDVLRWAQQGGRLAAERGWHRTLFRYGVDGARRWLESPEVRRLVVVNLENIAEDYAGDSPARRLGKWVAESVNALNYDDLASAFIRTLREELTRMLEEDTHPARADFDAWVERTLRDLGEESELRTRAQTLLDELIGGGRLDLLLRDAAARLREAIINDIDSEGSKMLTVLDSQLTRILDRLHRDTAARERLDRWIKDRLIALVDKNHDEIGRMVQDNLERLDDEELVSQIEEKVGDDLQFIRVNGAVVGGLVGAVLYVVTWLIG
jgi:uncharacterized membrane-anchored protein YjiN (DUF445 family)